MTTLHGTVVEVGGCGVLLRGPPGSGKSSLALRLIDEPGFGLGATPLRTFLVADDQFELLKTQAGLVAKAPASLAGLLEIRGVGIVKLAYRAEVVLKLVVDLSPAATLARMPEPDQLITELSGVRLKRLMLEAADPAATAKIRASLF
jgi:serine kinase of HPr protein (carbohydrate metabolism regulator)